MAFLYFQIPRTPHTYVRLTYRESVMYVHACTYSRMPRKGYTGMTVKDETHRAVRTLRDSDDDFGSVDDALQYVLHLVHLKTNLDFLDEELIAEFECTYNPEEVKADE